jgi:hypothetical protein
MDPAVMPPHLAVVIGAGPHIGSSFVSGADAKHAFDSTDDASDCAADDRSDRASTPVALVHSMRDPAGNTLSLGGQRCRNGDQDYASKYQLEVHETPLFSFD